jgi:hypothetical protein
MSLNVFAFGKSQAGFGSGNNNKNNGSSNMLVKGEVSHVQMDVAKAGEDILEYGASVQRGELFDSDRDLKPSVLFEQDSLVEFMK